MKETDPPTTATNSQQSPDGKHRRTRGRGPPPGGSLPRDIARMRRPARHTPSANSGRCRSPKRVQNGPVEPGDVMPRPTRQLSEAEYLSLRQRFSADDADYTLLNATHPVFGHRGIWDGDYARQQYLRSVPAIGRPPDRTARRHNNRTRPQGSRSSHHQARRSRVARQIGPTRVMVRRRLLGPDRGERQPATPV